MSRIGRTSWLTAVPFALALSVTSCALADGIVTAAAGVEPVAPDQEMTFLDQWRSHISGFVGYAPAAAAADVTEALRHNAETLVGAIDSFSGAFVH
jgi:hypothetical protein